MAQPQGYEDLGANRLGELAAVSVAPAIADAADATGKRVRELPITVEKLS
jgi:CO/xanthine dehydrogenase Mo-binding subunit